MVEKDRDIEYQQAHRHEGEAPTRAIRQLPERSPAPRDTQAGGAQRPSLAALASHWGVGAVLACYVASAFLIPTLADVSVTDDWVYYRTVETLLTEHRLHVHDMSSAALVFQTIWGAAFAALFGLSFGVLRLSTLVLVGVSGLAFYALCRELDVSRGRSALGMGAYLFHPLALSLAYTFMTDPHFTSLLVISVWLYVRGLKRESVDPRYMLAGSIVAACALLVRQQGVLLPAGVAAALVLSRRLTLSRRGLLLLAQTCAIPAVITLGYAGWLRFFHGVPWAMRLFRDEIARAGWTGIAGLVPRLMVIEAMYLGLFVLPIAVAALPLIPRLRHDIGPRGQWALGAWAALVLGGALAFSLRGLTMPYVGQFVTSTGLGPEDLLGARPTLLDTPLRVALTVACALAAVTLGLALTRHLGSSGASPRAAVGLLFGVGFGQVLGTLPPSAHFINWGGTLDRYLLPLLPLVIVLVLWALRDVRLSAPVAWIAVLAMSLYAVAGTRDHLVFQQAVWSLAREANQLGVPNTRLDAGAGWDGFHLYERPPSSTVIPHTPGRPWWLYLYAPKTDSSYIVAAAPLPQHAVVLERSYSSWLHGRPVSLYLLRRPGVSGPP